MTHFLLPSLTFYMGARKLYIFIWTAERSLVYIYFSLIFRNQSQEKYHRGRIFSSIRRKSFFKMKSQNSKRLIFIHVLCGGMRFFFIIERIDQQMRLDATLNLNGFLQKLIFSQQEFIKYLHFKLKRSTKSTLSLFNILIACVWSCHFSTFRGLWTFHYAN